MNEITTEMFPEEAAWPDSAAEPARIIFDILCSQGVAGVVLSPGSRNAPLLIAAAARPELPHWIEADERTAAFMAMGIAMVKRRPVALVCTSGTALYNYAPAVAEAFYQGVPLIVISADRPIEWIDQDDSQTLHQPEALARIVKKSFDVGVPSEGKGAQDFRWYLNRVVNEACNLSMSGKPGPTHINVRLAPPLGSTVPRKPSNERVVATLSNPSSFPPHIINRLASQLRDKRIMIVAGFMPPDNALNSAVREMALLPNVVVVAETLSNLHLPTETYVIDPPLASPTKDSLIPPDIVITIGGAIVSRMLKTFLRESEGLEHWTLGDTDPGIDTFRRLTLHLDTPPLSFFRAIGAALRREFKKREADSSLTEYKSRWDKIRKESILRHEEIIRETPWSELKALDHIFRNLDPSTNLFLGNGTPVRYSQLSLRSLPHSCLGCRGVSGIDGTSASALGASIAYPGKTLLISGDLAFSYAPQILGSASVHAGFKIIVVNNSGGGIFRFIAATRDIPCREEYLCAAPNLPLEGLCSVYGVEYHRAADMDELQKEFPLLMTSPRPALLELVTPPEESAIILRSYLS